MVREILEWMNAGPGRRFVDATLGGGGHSAALLEASSPDGAVLGLDADPEAVARARERLAVYGTRFRAVHSRFSRLDEVAHAEGFVPADAVVFDLGVSSDQLQDPARGFSFQHDGPLDMRMDPHRPRTAADIVNTWSEDELDRLFREYGEEPRARRIAQAIVRARVREPILRTLQLAEVVADAVGGRRGRLHPATRVFQALRIVVNQELEELERGLTAALSILRVGGRVVVIAFHSLEDRIVKQMFRTHEPRQVALQEGGCRSVVQEPPVRILTRHPVRPRNDEVQRNPRARSARLRVAERIGG
jgi:16S rRNA (cytosine1402-N4)-methyltransferase